eukprot:Selendium_serpulae@DN6642_c0_g1_i1.p1
MGLRGTGAARWTRGAVAALHLVMLGTQFNTAMGKTVIGLVEGKEYGSMASFCFNSGETDMGAIKLQAFALGSGHQIRFPEAFESEEACEAIQSTLLPPVTLDGIGGESSVDLSFTVDTTTTDTKRTSAVMTRCGNEASAQFRVEFTNPGGRFQRHFSCEDQGLYGLALVFTLMAGLGLWSGVFAWRK